MAASGASTALGRFSRPEMAVVGICALLGVAATAMGWLSGIALAIAVVVPILLTAALGIFGVTGSILGLCAVSSVYLMNRIDEGVVIPFGETSLKASYWLVMASALVLLIIVLFRLVSSRDLLPGATNFASRFTMLMLGFGGVMLLSGVMNHTLAQTTYNRDVVGELLAGASILTPMLFVPLILLAPMKRRHIIITLQAIIALGGIAGITMAAFGFLPAKLLDLLGWTAANQGTVGLLRGRLPLGHPNSVAAVLILLLPPTVVLTLIPGNRQFRAAYMLCAVCMFGGILFTLARSALLVTVLVLGLTVSYIFFGKGRKTAATYLLPVVFGVGLIAVMTYLFLTMDFSRFWSRAYYEDATVERRNASLVTSLYVFKDHPLWGITPDAMYTRLELRPGWEPPMSDKISPILYYEQHMSAETPHNMYLTVLAETGLLGAACFFGAIFSVFQIVWQLRRAPGLSDEQRHALMAFMLGMLGFLLMGAFESVLMVGIRPAFLFWAVAGLTVRYAHEIAAPADTPARS